MVANSENILKIWAKKKGDKTYPLIYHMLDTAAVALQMWNTLLQQGVRYHWALYFHKDPNATGKLISFWAGLHDIGKACSGFQLPPHDTRHDIVSAYVLINQFRFNRQIAVALGGHHGTFPQSIELNDFAIAKEARDKDYGKLREFLFHDLKRICAVDDYNPDVLSKNQAFFMFLTGLTSIADWLASNEEYFSYNNQGETSDKHFEYAGQQALKVMQKLFWSEWQPQSDRVSFTSLFPFIRAENIRPLQIESINIAGEIRKDPGLIIIEAPMGEGKTEAAIFLADACINGLNQKGCYFALPSQATSNQMFGRFEDYLKRRYPNQKMNYLLLHGHAALSTEFQELRNIAWQFVTGKLYDAFKPDDKAPPNIVAAEWFTHRKRGLLSPFGLGTIDQGLLSVLQTRHVFVRLFGLAGKTIIIDEVHAYDAYMTTLLERMLEWMAALGSSVVLLSATLPGSKRVNLLRAYRRGLNVAETEEKASLAAKYPRISWISSKGEEKDRHIGTSINSTRKIKLEWLDERLSNEADRSFGDFQLGLKLKGVLANGGCAAVICNTVDKAQKIYQALQSYFPGVAEDSFPELELLHSRFLYGDRSEREKRCLLRFGKPNSKVTFDDGAEREVKRPQRAVQVATQIIEQSLDLDFDVMFTEMAPADLLLQRSGRLQRHDRPERLCNPYDPTLWVFKPEEKSDRTPDFGGGTEAVYERHVLLRSWLQLKERKSIAVPEEVEQLIEAVYGERECPDSLPDEIKKDWRGSADKLSKAKNEYMSKAKTFSILPPYYEDDILEDFNRELEEDNPSLNESLQALTRLTEPTISTICLYGTKESAYLDTELSQHVKTNAYPDMELVKQLLYQSVTVSRIGLVQILAKEYPIPEEWNKNALLRHYSLLFFNRDNNCQIRDFKLTLDKEKGLLITKIGK